MEDIGKLLGKNLADLKIKKAGGQTNKNFIVKEKDKRFFVRLPWQMEGIVDREIEARNIKALMENEKTKQVIPFHYVYVFKGKNILGEGEYDLPDGALVADYIEGKDITGSDLRKENIQQSLVETLQTFHSSGVLFANKYDALRDEVKKYREKAETYSLNELISEKDVDKLKEIEKEVREEVPFSGQVSTHNDLIFENLRLAENGKVYLIDFEYAGLNIRDGLHYDLGIILGGNLFQKDPILKKDYSSILKKASEVYQKDFDAYRAYLGAIVNILVMFWWGVVKYFNSKDKEYFKDYCEKRSQGVIKLYSEIKRGSF